MKALNFLLSIVMKERSDNDIDEYFYILSINSNILKCSQQNIVKKFLLIFLTLNSRLNFTLSIYFKLWC